MKVLVLGGAGYIGSHVAHELLDRNYEVLVYDNLSKGLKSNLIPNVKFFHKDILDSKSLVKAMESCEALIYLAAAKAVGESMEKPEYYSEQNICGAVSVLNSALKTGIKYVVFSSSAAVYGSPNVEYVDEETPTNPENYYGFTKLEIEKILAWYSKLKNIRYSALRYFNAAGYDIKNRVRGLEKDPQNLIPVIMETAIGKRSRLKIFGNDYPSPDGSCIRDYIHVSDLASAHADSLDFMVKNNKDLILNLGTKKGYTVFEVLESARRISGMEIPADIVARRPGDPPRLVANPDKAYKVLNWKSKNSDIDTIIKSTWQVYKNLK